jgi:hypothetical protein
MLQEIYNWFREGFGTADLKRVKELLKGMCGSATASEDQSQGKN